MALFFLEYFEATFSMECNAIVFLISSAAVLPLLLVQKFDLVAGLELFCNNLILNFFKFYAGWSKFHKLTITCQHSL
jgi:hypothetical protein